MSEVLDALRAYDEYAAPTERWQSTGQLIHEAAEEIEQLENLLDRVWDIARDNHLEYRARIDSIMSTIREKPAC